MTTAEVLQFYGSKARTVEALAVTRQAVEQWMEKGRPPTMQQFRIQVLTGGQLKADQ